MARVIENGDGSLSIDPNNGENISSFQVCADILAQYYLDRAKVSNRLAKVLKETGGSALEQAKAEITAEKSLAEAKLWINRMRPSGKNRSDRETR